MAFYRCGGGGDVTKLSNIQFSGDHYNTSANISTLYTDYQKITIDNIAVEIIYTAVNGSATYTAMSNKSYNTSTGVITLTSPGSFDYLGNVKANIYIFG